MRFILNLKTSPQGGRNSRSSSPTGEVNEAIEKLGSYLLKDIAFKAAASQQRQLQNQLEAKFAGIARSELSSMARKINNLGIGLADTYRAPTGGSSNRQSNLTLEGPVSPAMLKANPSVTEPMSIQAVSGQWRARTQEYLQRKAKKYGHRRWFLNTGQLRDALKNPQMYISAYGPIRVSWKPKKISSQFLEHGATRFSNITRGAGKSYTIQTGEIHMTVLGNITRNMLANPGERSYDSRFNGLFGRLPEDVELKLQGRGEPYRVLIEPFLTYYLNRQIPNRIFYELERSIKPI